MIFRLLPIRYKILLERTCIRWQDLLRRSWSRFSCLDLSVEKWAKRPLYFVNNELVSFSSRSASMIRSAVIRCGLYVTTIDFVNDKVAHKIIDRYKFSCTNNCILQLISSNCIKLKNINVKICCVEGLKSLAENFSTLEAIYFFGLQHFETTEIDKCLRILIQNNSRLNSISFNEINSLNFLMNIEHKMIKISLTSATSSVNQSEDILASCIKNSHLSLKKFSLKVFELDFVAISEQLRHCKNLTKLKIHANVFVNIYTEARLANIFLGCENIQSVSISGLNNKNSTIESHCGTKVTSWLHHVNPATLNQLYLSATAENKKYLLKEFPAFINLRYLALSGINSEDDKKLFDTIAMCSNLEIMQFSECNFSMKTSKGQYIFRYLKKLQYLSIENSMNSNLDENDLVNAISIFSNQLEKLQLCLVNLTDAGLKYLPNLKRLCSLSIFFSAQLVGSNLFRINTLKKLECICCKKLQDESLKLLIKEAVNLSKMVIFYCPNVTRELIKFAIKEKKTQILNQDTLTIAACIRNLKSIEFKHRYPGLNLELVNDINSTTQLEN